MAESSKPVARAETVGSLLQPDALLEARKSGDEAARSRPRTQQSTLRLSCKKVSDSM